MFDLNSLIIMTNGGCHSERNEMSRIILRFYAVLRPFDYAQGDAC